MAKQLNRVISEKKDFSNLVTIWKVSDFRDKAIVGGLYSGSGKQMVRLLKKIQTCCTDGQGMLPVARPVHVQREECGCNTDRLRVF